MVFIPWSGYKIYENKFLSLLEATFLLNLVLLAVTTHQVKKAQKDLLSYASAGIAFAVFLIIILYHNHISLMRLTVYRKNLERVIKKLSIFILSPKPKAVQSQELQNKNEIQTTFVDMREPLLEEPLT